MKKLTALFLALALCLSLCTVTAFADSQAGEPLCFTATGAGSITLTKRNDYSRLKNISLQCKINDGSWETYDVGTPKTFSKAGDTVSFRAPEGTVNKTFSIDSVDCYTFTVSDTTVAASGDVTTLLDANGVTNLADTTGEREWDDCFYYLFLDCIGLTEAPELPSTTLAWGCYYGMFNGCKGLTSAPKLPATTLARSCYSGMFRNCVLLTTAPKLPATALAAYCYDSMFMGCEGLTTAPELPATTLADYCYEYMFQDCKGLTTAPELPATTLADSCYYRMFMGCKALEEAPVLPAKTLVRVCYAEMFKDCTKLSKATMYASDVSAEYCLYDWLSGVAASGVVVKPANTTLPDGASGLPNDWTTEELYTVTFDAKGHGTAPAAITNVASGTTINKPTDPTAAGYTFGGWYKETGCTNAWDFA